MGSAQGRIEVDAAPSTVWGWVTDPSHFPDFVEGWRDGGAVTPNATGPNAEYCWIGAIGPLRLRARERVTEWREGERVRYEGRLAGVPFHSSMRVEPAGGGRSQLEVQIDWDLPLALGGGATDRLLRPIVQADVDRSLERVAAAFATDRAEPGIPTRSEVVHVYRKRAARYDIATQLYRLVGFPLARARRQAADLLALEPGDTVVEIGCGTGANFPLLQERVGPTGRIIGVDLTDRMLEQARERVHSRGWRNVELVFSDAATFAFPAGVNGIVSTFALSLCRDYETVIERGAQALTPGGRWVILDLKLPEGTPKWLIRAALPFVRPYGVSVELGARHPWESLPRHLSHTWIRNFYFGLAYLAVGEKAAPGHAKSGASLRDLSRCPSADPEAESRPGVPSRSRGRRTTNERE